MSSIQPNFPLTEGFSLPPGLSDEVVEALNTVFGGEDYRFSVPNDQLSPEISNRRASFTVGAFAVHTFERLGNDQASFETYVVPPSGTEPNNFLVEAIRTVMPYVPKRPDFPNRLATICNALGTKGLKIITGLVQLTSNSKEMPALLVPKLPWDEIRRLGIDPETADRFAIGATATLFAYLGGSYFESLDNIPPHES